MPLTTPPAPAPGPPASLILEVVICTCNRALFLEKALRALAPQLAAEPGAGIIVVDNNSTDNTRALVEEYAGSPVLAGRVRYVHEGVQGVAHARNRGLAECSAPWIGYLDDDGIPYPDWIARALATIVRDEFDAFGGVFLPLYAFGPKPYWLEDDFGSNLYTQSWYGPLRDNETPCGGNMFVKTETLRAVGGFPTTLGMSGKVCAYGEETFAGIALRKSGARMGFDPEMIIDHHVLPAKYRMRWHFRSHFVRGRDYWLIHDLEPKKSKGVALALSLPFIALRDVARGAKKLHKSGCLGWRSLYFFVGCRVSRRLGRINGAFSYSGLGGTR